MQVLCDIDDQLRFSNSICGNVAVNGIDILFMSLLQRSMDLDTSHIADSLKHIAPQLQPLHNIERLLTHLTQVCPCGGLDALLKKE